MKHRTLLLLVFGILIGICSASATDICSGCNIPDPYGGPWVHSWTCGGCVNSQDKVRYAVDLFEECYRNGDPSDVYVYHCGTDYWYECEFFGGC